MKNTRSTCLAIERASTQEQVIASVREYLSSLSPAEVALMPAGLAALSTSRAEEVVQSAFQLVHHEMLVVLNAPEAGVIKEAVLVFSTAATRLAALAALNVLNPPGTDPPAATPVPAVAP
jgi:hypothetical protein